MGDQAYQQRASRQRKLVILAVLTLVGIGCAAFAISNTFYDRCTRSFNRQPEAVVSSYVDALARGDLNRVENCWDRDAYFDLNSGCSEICVSRVMGKGYTISKVDMGQAADENGRSRLKASITATCPNGTAVTGEAELDTIAGQVPWKHWRIIHSTVGGSTAKLWCQ